MAGADVSTGSSALGGSFRDAGLAGLHAEYAATRDRRTREALAAAYDGLAVGLARRFPSRRDSLDDYVQVARLGLLHAIDRFDPARERPFASFAGATISGELKRHVRDRTWSLRVPRSLQEHWLVVVRTVEDLTHELGRSPAVTEVSRRSGLSPEQVLEAMELGHAVRPVPFEAPAHDDQRVVEPGRDDDGFTALDDHDMLRGLLGELGHQERLILELRYCEGLTQSQIGARIGMSQMGVSRLLARTLERLRTRALRPGR